ncbi:hypothetical protein E2C01_030185 [Portunus trituberculatus]|uniref:Uncharacterized protein n=1 Tax=Portunus trituberculatus TaxID=210409 RepID=A0A5B7EU25_PORTR|nr:hypothetical protein [Portunus trituberculatus]
MCWRGPRGGGTQQATVTRRLNTADRHICSKNYDTPRTYACLPEPREPLGPPAPRLAEWTVEVKVDRRGELAPSSPPPPPGHVAKPPLQRVPPSAEPVSMSTVIGIVIACLVILVLVTLIVLYAFKTEKWCFSLTAALSLETKRGSSAQKSGWGFASPTTSIRGQVTAISTTQRMVVLAVLVVVTGVTAVVTPVAGFRVASMGPVLPFTARDLCTE